MITNNELLGLFQFTSFITMDECKSFLLEHHFNCSIHVNHEIFYLSKIREMIVKIVLNGRYKIQFVSDYYYQDF